jgi:hypothetical protein
VGVDFNELKAASIDKLIESVALVFSVSAVGFEVILLFSF